MRWGKHCLTRNWNGALGVFLRGLRDIGFLFRNRQNAIVIVMAVVAEAVQLPFDETVEASINH